MTLTHTLHVQSWLKETYLCQALLCLCLFWTGCFAARGHNCFSVPSLSPILHGKKHHGWHVFDTVHLFCLWTMHFKEGQDARIAKCVPNKWYPSQDGSSLESVLAKGSKSMGLRQHPSSLSAGTHSRGTDGLSWLGSSKGLWPRASRLLWELAAPLRPLSEERWKPSRERITMRQTVKRERWWISEFY